MPVGNNFQWCREDINIYLQKHCAAEKKIAFESHQKQILITPFDIWTQTSLKLLLLNVGHTKVLDKKVGTNLKHWLAVGRSLSQDICEYLPLTILATTKLALSQLNNCPSAAGLSLNIRPTFHFLLFLGSLEKRHWPENVFVVTCNIFRRHWLSE